ERTLLLDHGWRDRDALSFSCDMEAYRQYILNSKAEITDAKEQHTRRRSGCCSEQSATYHQAHHPEDTQETEYNRILPKGHGQYGISTMDEAVSAIEAINNDYESHRKGAAEVARSYFSHDVVLAHLLAELGITGRTPTVRGVSDRPSISLNLVADLSGHTG